MIDRVLVPMDGSGMAARTLRYALEVLTDAAPCSTSAAARRP